MPFGEHTKRTVMDGDEMKAIMMSLADTKENEK